MEQKYKNFAISLDSMDCLDITPCYHSEYGNITLKECIEKEKLPDEIFHCFTFFNEGDFDKNIIQRLSYNFIPHRVFIHHVPEDKEKIVEIFRIFNKYNCLNFIYAVGHIGWDGDDMPKQNVTIEILVDIEYTKQLQNENSLHRPPDSI